MSLVDEAPEVLLALVTLVQRVEGVWDKGVVRGWGGELVHGRGIIVPPSLKGLSLQLVDAHQDALLMELVLNAHVLQEE